MQTATIDLYDLLKIKIGEIEAKALVTYIETEAEKKIEQKKEGLASKEDIARLEAKIADTKAEILKWMFAQAFVIITIVVVLVKLL